MKLTKQTLKQIIKEELDAVMNEESLDESSERFIMYLPGQNEFQIMLGSGKSITYMYRLAGQYEQALKNYLHSIAGTNRKPAGKLGRKESEFISQTLASKTDAKITPEELMQMPVRQA